MNNWGFKINPFLSHIFKLHIMSNNIPGSCIFNVRRGDRRGLTCDNPTNPGEDYCDKCRNSFFIVGRVECSGLTCVNPAINWSKAPLEAARAQRAPGRELFGSTRTATYCYNV